MVAKSLDTLPDEVTDRIVKHLVSAPTDGHCSPLLSFFNLAQTNRRLRRVLDRPEDDEGYWKQLLLTAGLGRPCQQKYATEKVEDVPWAHWAKAVASWDRRKHRGRQWRVPPDEVIPQKPSSWYNWATDVLGDALREFLSFENGR